jgi:alanine dehydrogenase
MLHFNSHAQRAMRLKALGVNAIALDTIIDDEGTRLVEDMRAVAWNGVDAAFRVLMRSQPDFKSRRRPHTHVTILGAGMVGRHAVEAATKFGDRARADRLRVNGIPGAEVTVLGRNMTDDETYMRWRLAITDVLVDAVAREDLSQPILPNDWLGELPEHAVICDLAVDPYLPLEVPPVVRGIEGIPMGDMSHYEFSPDDPAWEELPPCVPTDNRRWVVSCYGWPGIQPEASMLHYGEQIAPLMDVLIERGGASGLRTSGTRLERALCRGSLRSKQVRVAELVDGTN